MTNSRYEVREDADVDPRALVNYPDQRYCVWDTQTDSVYRVDPSGAHPHDAASVTGGAPRFGPVSEDSAREMADFLNAGSVSIYEDNSGAVYVERRDEMWALGPVTPDMHGKAAVTAWSWCAGEWEPNEHDGQARASVDGLTLIATWRTDGTLKVETDQDDEPVAGAGGLAFIGNAS